MTKHQPKNIAASVRQRLQNLARLQSEDFQLVLGRFALERLIYRLNRSRHGQRFVLKGAMLFHLWSDHPYRPTRDIDFLAVGNPSPEQMEDVFREICIQDAENDGLIFLPDSVAGEVIKPEQAYEGVRIQLEARLERARVPLQIDIGFGDAITPHPLPIAYPSMLGFPTLPVVAYPKETVVAEKLHAMVFLGMANSRMKDFFDLWVLARHFDFDGETLRQAIAATFARRQFPLPEKTPPALSSTFSNDPNKLTQWKAFVNKSNLKKEALSLEKIVTTISEFLRPPMEHARLSQAFAYHWAPAGPWQPGHASLDS